MKAICWLLLLIAALGSSFSSSLVELTNDEDVTTGRIRSSEIEGSSTSQEDLESLKTLLRQTSETGSENGTVTATSQGPCQCAGGICGCCSKIIYNTWKQKLCVNVTYDPNEFSFTVNILMNDGVLYTRTVSGKCKWALT